MVASWSKLQADSSIQPVQEDESPPHTPQLSTTADPPHTPLQSSSTAQAPSQSKFRCSSAKVHASSSAMVASWSKLQADSSIQPVQEDESPPHTPQLSTTADPP